MRQFSPITLQSRRLISVQMTAHDWLCSNWATTR